MTSGNATRAIAERVCPIRYADLGADTLAMVKRLIADGVAVAIAGSAQEPPRILADHALALGGAARATVWVRIPAHRDRSFRMNVTGDSGRS